MITGRFIYRSGQKNRYRYANKDGSAISTDDLPEHATHLAIPPAWKDVTIAKSPNAKVLATGIDAAGRKQYLYNPKFRSRQDEAKFDRIVQFGSRLSRMRQITRKHLDRPELDREKVLACMLRLIDQAYFRVGNERYVEENSTYGLTTMRMRHVSVEDGQLIFRFVGKSHQEHELEVDDASLARVVEELQELPGSHIFSYINEENAHVDVDSQDVNDYIKEVMDDEFSAKDFRTWAGTLIAASCLSETNIPRLKKDREVSIRTAIERASEALGNTPEIAKKSYIDPRILQLYRNGESLTPTMDRLKRKSKRSSEDDLSVEEQALILVLKKL
ncbi:MAG: DNA topoisomerase IB [Patescibacteria group bacterium]